MDLGCQGVMMIVIPPLVIAYNKENIQEESSEQQVISFPSIGYLAHTLCMYVTYFMVDFYCIIT